MTRRIIGLTGGIACGKTTVSNYLSHHHFIPVLDADIYARDAVKSGSPILGKIISRYGKFIVKEDGNLDRKKLGEIIFNDADEKVWLESQIHPYVRECFIDGLNRLGDDIIVFAIPLLFEANLTAMVTEIWVVYCRESVQIERLMARDGLTAEQALSRIESQLPLEEKVARADVVLNNINGLDSLYREVDRYLKTK
ncbi:MAG: Dephospho-CoA kinase [Chroococcopsis gigantea SAG 12.99]|jgi:dephospho-CoA kinase|nr:dephospho-CoA kinase [Chlorogloea purpurea SAG 13.99]MDV3002306.1 Dephospho-CoA kinase [Chroococcopsis gigantea SAG 12.99]